MEKITKTRVPDDQRADFLPCKVGKPFLRFEMGVYSQMERFCHSGTRTPYTGGYWEFFELSNGGFFMAMQTDSKLFHVDFPANYFEKDMTPEAVSIAACLFSLNGLCWQTESKQIADAFYRLRDFALEHIDAGKIMRLID